MTNDSGNKQNWYIYIYIYLIVLLLRKEQPAGQACVCGRRVIHAARCAVCSACVWCVCSGLSRLLLRGGNTPDCQRVWDCTYSVDSWKVWIFSTAVLGQCFTFYLSSYSLNSPVSFIKELSQFTDSEMAGLVLSFYPERERERERIDQYKYTWLDFFFNSIQMWRANIVCVCSLSQSRQELEQKKMKQYSECYFSSH